MSSAIKIIPDHLRTVLTPSIRRDEANILAVDYGGDMEVIEVAEELNDVAKLKESSTFDADIPYNTINRWIVNSYGNSVPVLVNAHGLQFPDRVMQVNGYSEPGANFDVGFVRSQEWPEFLKNLSLIELDGFDPFQMSEAFIDDNQLNDAAYPDTGATPTRGFYTPLAYYGGLQRFSEANSLFQLIYADFRLWFHYGKILEQCFFAAGWKMDCPFLRTEYGQRLAWLLVGGQIYEGYYSKMQFYGVGGSSTPTDILTSKLQLPCSSHYAFKVEKTAPQAIVGAVTPNFNGEIITFQNKTTGGFYDNGSTVWHGFYRTDTELIQAFTGKWRYNIKLKITGGAGPEVCVLGFFEEFPLGLPNTYALFFDAGGNQLSAGTTTITVPALVTTEFDFYATVECLTSVWDFGFGFASGSNVTVEAASTLEGFGEYIIATNEPTVLGDSINLSIVFPQSWLSPKIKGIEVLEDYCHRTHSKIYTDRARRIVGIYTAQDVLTYGEETEPYFFETVEQDLSLMQVDQSAQVNTKDVVAPAKYILGFKETTDEYIASVQKDTPFDAVIDMAPYAENIDPYKTVENRCNLTEPTLERPFIEIKSPNPNHTPISVMAVLDNMVGEASTRTAPRTAYIYGRVKQKIAGSVFHKTYIRRWGGVTAAQLVFAYATQYPSGEIEDAAGVAIDNDKTLVYDHTEAVTEPMKRYWLDFVSILYTAQTRKLIVIVGSFNRFVQMNFRALYRFKFMGLDWKGRLVSKRTKINDFHRVEVEVREDKVC